MADEANLWKAVKLAPLEDMPKLALADWYDEHGDHDMAFALRWLVKRDKWPWFSTRLKRPVIWWGRFKNRESRNNLPRSVFDAMPRNDRGWHIERCQTFKSAVLKVNIALCRLKRDLSLDA